MYTEFKDNEGKKNNVTTQQYQIGTYVIFDNDPSTQCATTLKESLFHKKLREKILDDNGTLLAGSIIDIESDKSINEFKQEENG